MPVMRLREFSVVVCAVAVIAAGQVRVAGQVQGPRPLPAAIDPIITTRLESLLATPNQVVIADYYWIDMRFGPNLRVDAVVVLSPDARVLGKGLRVQVRDPESRGRQDGTSFIDYDELVMLSRALGTIVERAERWTHDDRRATELFFTTMGGFRLAVRQSARVPRAFISTGLFDPVVTSLDINDLPTLKSAFEQALTLLNSK